MAIEAKKTLAFAEAVSLAVAALADRLKGKVRICLAVDKAKTTVVENLKEFSKEIAAFKRKHKEQSEKGEIPGDWKFSRYWKTYVGGVCPGRGETLAALFNTLCLVLKDGQPMLSEENFDSAKVAWLETANKCINHAMEEHGDAWMTCDDVLDVVNALSKPGDAQETLDAIRVRQKKGKSKSEEEACENAAPLTAKLAVEYLLSLIRNAQPDDVGEGLFVLTQSLQEAWAVSEKIPNETLTKWYDVADAAAKAAIAERAKALAAGIAEHIKVITEEAPAEVGAVTAPLEIPAELEEVAA